MSELDKVKQLIALAKRITILTGAGISTDSGIPDFRGKNGLWTLNPDAEKLSTIENYVKDPEMRQRSWDMYVNGWGDYKPNAGHKALAKLAQDKLVTIVTQNIDGLHKAAGNIRVYEIHGNLNEIKCLGCDNVWFKSKFLADNPDTVCSECGGMLKPNIIYFGENLDAVLWQDSINAAINCDIFLAIGTSLQVWPAADLVDVASKWHKKVIIINGSSTAYDDYADIVLNGSISDILTELVN